MPNPVEDRFLSNLERVRGMVSLYVRVLGLVPGGPSVEETDLLRAAVVLLHATCEELFRDLAAERLPDSDKDTLSAIPYAKGDGRATRFTLGELVEYRGQLVDVVITESIDAYLDRRSYNDTNDLAAALKQIRLPPGLVEPQAAELQAMMKRRHQIAHRLDVSKSGVPGSERHQLWPITKMGVEGWIGAVPAFGKAVLAATNSSVDSGGS